MTQPAGPYGFPARPPGAAGPYGFDPLPSAPSGQGAAVPAQHGVDWGAIQQAEAQETTAAPPAEDPNIAALREKHGIVKTTGDQFFRGVFDALLSPGALLGTAAESLGSAIGGEALRDLGRDIGEASTGTAAAELLNELAGGDSGTIRERFAEEDQARPLLSTISRGAGMVGLGLASGGASTARGAVALGAIEGSGAGAQTAYENNAPLRDVLASAALGGVFGAALPGSIVGAQKGYQAAKKAFANADLGEAAREALGKFSVERGAKALGFNPSAIKKLGRDAPAAEREMRHVVEDVMAHKLDDGTPVFQATQSGDDLAARVQIGREQLGEKLGALRAQADEFIETKAPELRLSPQQIAARIETEVVAPLAASRVDAVKAQAAEVQALAQSVREMGETAGLAQMRKVQEDLASVVYPRSPTGGLMPPVRDVNALFKADRIIEDVVGKRMDDVTAAMGQGRGYQELKRLNRSFIKAAQVSGAENLADLGRRAFSLSDTLAGVAAFGGDIATGGAVSALKGIAAAGVHKMLRERSSSVLAVLSNKLARTPKPSVSVAAVGGREAQTVIQDLVQAKTFLREAGESAGDNPNVRREAENLAKDAVAERIQHMVGDFDPVRWADRSPTPVQKVMFRGEILNRASEDMATAAARVQQLRPVLPEALDVARLGKLMKDADRPAAIGAVQNKLIEMANDAPPTPGAADLAHVFRRAAERLETAEAGEAMQIAHSVRTEIARARQVDEAMGLRQPADAQGFDSAQYDQAFGQRSSDQLRDILGSETFGEAGALYRAATLAGDAHAKFTDPAAIREALRKADARGPLPAALHDANEQIIAAMEARARLTGEKVPPGLVAELRASEELFAAGEEAATLDGRRMDRILEHIDDAPKGPDPQKAVWDAVSPEIDKLVPVIKAEAGQSKRGKYRPGLSRAAGSEGTERVFQLPEEQLIEHEQRLEKVAEVMADPRRVEETGVDAGIAPVVGEKLAQFLNDVPKPKQDIRGKAFETMSSNDLRLAAAMWEATVEPLSVLSDFRSGMIDYDKVQYAWKQWPGLQLAVQAGILDVLQQDLDDDERAGLSDTMLTQLDYLAGFGGRLQASLDPAFSARIETLNTAPEQAKPPRGGAALSTPKAEPTFTERVAGAQS